MMALQSPCSCLKPEGRRVAARSRPPCIGAPRAPCIQWHPHPRCYAIPPESQQSSEDIPSSVHETLKEEAEAAQQAAASGRTQQESQQASAATGSPVVEATNVFEPGEAGGDSLGYSSALPLMPDAVTQQAVTVYVALAAVYLMQGAGLAAVAWVSPALLLPATAMGPLASTLLGCAAAASVTAAGLLLHLWQTAAAGELGTWRHQRINMALIAYALVTFLSSAWAAPASHPILTGVLLTTSLACAAACTLVTRACMGHGPWLHWCIVWGNIDATWRIVRAFLLRDVSTLAGVACLTWLAACASGATGVLLDPVSWGMDEAVAAVHAVTGAHPLYPYATPAAAVAALDGLRRALGGGLLLSAVVAHTLLEAATSVRRLGLMSYIKANLVKALDDDSPYEGSDQALLRPPYARFAILHFVSVLLGGGLLCAFLARGAALGVDLNRDAALMAPLHWSAMLMASYLVLNILVVDWSYVYGGFQRVFGFFADIVSFITQTLVLRLEWTRSHKL